MIQKIAEQLKKKIVTAIKAIRARIESVLYEEVTSPVSACLPFMGFVVLSGAADALNVRLQYNKRSGQAPVFSLFAFFKR